MLVRSLRVCLEVPRSTCGSPAIAEAHAGPVSGADVPTFLSAFRALTFVADEGKSWTSSTITIMFDEVFRSRLDSYGAQFVR